MKSYFNKSIITLFILLIITCLIYLVDKGYLGEHPYLLKKSFSSLPNWEQDDHAQALTSFLQSCKEILSRDDNAPFSTTKEAGTVKNWKNICLQASQVQPNNQQASKQFFENWFTPYAINNNFHASGLFTGYYLPLLRGSLKQDAKYTVPVYGLPRDWVRVNLAAFNSDLPDKRIIGQLKNHRLLPYPDRIAINQGAIHTTAPILLWVDDAVALFFAQIQGSTLVDLPNGKRLLLGYAGSNGHPYTAIGKVMIDHHLLDRASVSMQTIKAWLKAHPEQQDDILNQNASYVFFQLLNNKAPFGSEHVPLTPKRSLAVDTHYIPLGAPVWLDTTFPQNPGNNNVTFQHLLIAQDTGGHIKGVIRGDVYWGAGEQADYIAGHMKNKGKIWLLLPKNL